MSDSKSTEELRLQVLETIRTANSTAVQEAFIGDLDEATADEIMRLLNQEIGRYIAEGALAQQKQVIEWARQWQPDDELLHSALNNGLATLNNQTKEGVGHETN